MENSAPIDRINNLPDELLSHMLEMALEYRDFLLLQNLVHLEISFNHMHHLDDVVEVLQNCPKLQILSITKGTFLHHKDFYRNWKNPNINCS
ncbi:FBD-associated F-box protein [Trifolium repens]|nr:FBD-associated F-box protein [Trifolium repens]